jgi:hypothetical protein
LTFYAINHGGFGCSNISFNCNNLCSTGVYLNGASGGYFQNMCIVNPASCGLHLSDTTGNTTSWNTFINTKLRCPVGNKGAIWLGGSAGFGNACHNSFMNTSIDFGGSMHGILLGGCDNNYFSMTFIFAIPTPTGYGVYVDPTEYTGFPLNNSFYHLEASTQGWYQPAGTTVSPARIYGYMQDNGEPTPVLSSNGSTLLPCSDVTYPLTVAAGSGWSGGTPTFSASYVRDPKKVTVTITITGTAIVAAANATITGLPANGTTLGVVRGTNATSGNAIFGYVTGTTMTIQSGLTSTNLTTLIAEYTV